MAPIDQRVAHSVSRPDLSVKLERLRRGLIADTVSLPKKVVSAVNRDGNYNPLQNRSKQFRKAVATYAPPYYFWHKRFISGLNLKPVIKAEREEEEMETSDDKISCIWCHRLIRKNVYVYHRLKKCQKRHEFMGSGYYRCTSCKESFLDASKARNHVSKHFPNEMFVDERGIEIQSQNTAPKHFDIICRDQAKRKKWL